MEGIFLKGLSKIRKHGYSPLYKQRHTCLCLVLQLSSMEAKGLRSNAAHTLCTGVPPFLEESSHLFLNLNNLPH